MNATARMSAAASPVVLHDGKTYQIAPLTDRQWDALELWAQNRTMQIARGSLTDDMTDDERREVLDAALATARSTNLIESGASDAFKTLTGMAYMLWQSLQRDNKPAPTLEECRALVAVSANAALFMEAFDLVNSFGATPDDADKQRAEKEAKKQAGPPAESADAANP